MATKYFTEPEDDILSESVDDEVDRAKSFLIRFYKHCLKWYYQSNRQGTSWTRSIIDSSKDLAKLMKGRTNTWNRTEEILYNCYLAGVKEAGSDMHSDVSGDSVVWQSFNTLSKIVNTDNVRAWLKSNQLDPDADFVDKKKNK